MANSLTKNSTSASIILRSLNYELFTLIFEIEHEVLKPHYESLVLSVIIITLCSWYVSVLPLTLPSLASTIPLTL